ncbi:MAG: hypothetical protein K0R83_1765 [Caulobacter sp.]|jgi:hypothetical protein|nr:hypothetical protein [Caulobacter sp.]
MTHIVLHRGGSRGLDIDRPDAVVSLATVLRPALEAILGRSLAGAKLVLRLSPEPAEPRLLGTPTLDNLVPDYGYAVVEVREGDEVIYRHPHTVREVVAAPLQTLLRNTLPEEGSWGFRIAFSGSENLVARPAPHVAGIVEATMSDDDRFGFAVRPLADPDPPEARLSDFGAPRPAHGEPVSVLVERSVFDAFDHGRPLSQRVEEGGFLVGSVYRDAEADDHHILRIQEAPLAQRTGASLLCFTFTGDSFREMKQEIGGRRLLGWWHTHLFQATESFGLSTIDVDVHLTTFGQPWQVAGLVNINPRDGRRVLRFYSRRAGMLVQCPIWVVDSRARGFS